MVDQNLKELIANGLFAVADFEQAWYELNQLYSDLGFSDQLTDEQRIAEYKWITQQLRKYMGTKEQAVLSCDSIQDMAATVEDMISKQREYGDTRQEVAYNFVRDHWLASVHSVLSQMAVSEIDEEEDE